jgi:hypothetical protein
MAGGFELREAKFFPYSQKGIHDISSSAGGLDRVRTNAGEVGSFTFAVDINNEFVKTEGQKMKLMYIAIIMGTQRVRFELPAPLPEFGEKFSVGDTVGVQAKGGAFYLQGVVNFSDDQYMELDLSIPIGGNNPIERYVNEEVLFRSLEQFKVMDIKYNLTKSGKKVYANGFDQGEIILTGEPESGLKIITLKYNF